MKTQFLAVALLLWSLSGVAGVKIDPLDIRPNTVDALEFGALNGIMGNIQSQLNAITATNLLTYTSIVTRLQIIEARTSAWNFAYSWATNDPYHDSNTVYNIVNALGVAYVASNNVFTSSNRMNGKLYFGTSGSIEDFATTVAFKDSNGQNAMLIGGAGFGRTLIDTSNVVRLDWQSKSLFGAWTVDINASNGTQIVGYQALTGYVATAAANTSNGVLAVVAATYWPLTSQETQTWAQVLAQGASANFQALTGIGNTEWQSSAFRTNASIVLSAGGATYSWTLLDQLRESVISFSRFSRVLYGTNGVQIPFPLGMISHTNISGLGSAATSSVSDFATAAQGALADTALQSIPAKVIAATNADVAAAVSSTVSNAIAGLAQSQSSNLFVSVAIGVTNNGLVINNKQLTNGISLLITNVYDGSSLPSVDGVLYQLRGIGGITNVDWSSPLTMSNSITAVLGNAYAPYFAGTALTNGGTGVVSQLVISGTPADNSTDASRMADVYIARTNANAYTAAQIAALAGNVFYGSEITNSYNTNYFTLFGTNQSAAVSRGYTLTSNATNILRRLMTTNLYASGSVVPKGTWTHHKYIAASANGKVQDYSYLRASDGVTTQDIAQGSFIFPTTTAQELDSYIVVPAGVVLTPTGMCRYVIDVYMNKIGGGADPTYTYYTGDGYPTRLDTPSLEVSAFAVDSAVVHKSGGTMTAGAIIDGNSGALTNWTTMQGATGRLNQVMIGTNASTNIFTVSYLGTNAFYVDALGRPVMSGSLYVTDGLGVFAPYQLATGARANAGFAAVFSYTHGIGLNGTSISDIWTTYGSSRIFFRNDTTMRMQANARTTDSAVNTFYIQGQSPASTNVTYKNGGDIDIQGGLAIAGGTNGIVNISTNGGAVVIGNSSSALTVLGSISGAVWQTSYVGTNLPYAASNVISLANGDLQRIDLSEQGACTVYLPASASNRTHMLTLEVNPSTNSFSLALNGLVLVTTNAGFLTPASTVTVLECYKPHNTNAWRVGSW